MAESAYVTDGYRIVVDGVQVAVASGFEAVNITGGSQAGVLVGGNGNDTLSGWRYNGDAMDADNLSGWAGNDVLSGMAAATG